MLELCHKLLLRSSPLLEIDVSGGGMATEERGNHTFVSNLLHVTLARKAMGKPCKNPGYAHGNHC